MVIAEQSGVIRYPDIKERGFIAAGVVAIISHEDSSGIKVLLVQHNGYDPSKVEEGQWGLPSETLHWCFGQDSGDSVTIKGVESLFAALIRCGREEMGVDLTQFDFSLYPENFVFQWPFRLNNSSTAYSRVISLWLETNSYVNFIPYLGELESKETSAVRFVPLDQIIGGGMNLRENTAEILTHALEQGFFGQDKGRGKRLNLNDIPEFTLADSRDFRLV